MTNIKRLNVLRELEKWYSSQCDGDWEHTNGLSIETIDNPGWFVKFDLSDTNWEQCLRPLVRRERSEFDWVETEIRDGIFRGSGGPENLYEIIDAFLCIVNGRLT